MAKAPYLAWLPRHIVKASATLLFAETHDAWLIAEKSRHPDSWLIEYSMSQESVEAGSPGLSQANFLHALFVETQPQPCATGEFVIRTTFSHRTDSPEARLKTAPSAITGLYLQDRYAASEY